MIKTQTASVNSIPSSESDAVESIATESIATESIATEFIATENHAAEAEIEFHQIDPRQITVNRISGLIFAAIVTLGVIIGLIVFLLINGLGLVWGILAGLGFTVSIFLLWMAIVWPVWEFRRTGWRLDETGLEIHRGVFWRHQISVPFARVQHADVSQGPLQRQFELGKLTVHTAGTQNAAVELDGIAHRLAIELRDEIVKQRESTDVV